jgi:hypothetical protein
VYICMHNICMYVCVCVINTYKQTYMHVFAGFLRIVIAWILYVITLYKCVYTCTHNMYVCIYIYVCVCVCLTLTNNQLTHTNKHTCTYLQVSYVSSLHEFYTSQPESAVNTPVMYVYVYEWTFLPIFIAWILHVTTWIWCKHTGNVCVCIWMNIPAYLYCMNFTRHDLNLM